MKFAHIADLHIGKRVHDFSMLEDQRYILDQMLGIFEEQRVDGILIAGDVYDKVVPSAEAVQLFDEFITRLAKLKMPVYMISGNHDSAERLSFGAKLFESSDIYISQVYDGKVKKVGLEDEYGNGRKDLNNLYYVKSKAGDAAGMKGPNLYSITGYFAKKLVHYESEVPQTGNAVFEPYPFPIIRLADLYLMYAEALNEATDGERNVPSDVYKYIDFIRERSGLKGVKDAWRLYSNNPDKPLTKSGMREIIRQERGIELALEGVRFYDIRRWNLGETEYNKVVRGWNIKGENKEDYYIVTPIFQMQYSQKDYLWPIKKYNIIINSNLVQNPGW